MHDRKPRRQHARDQRPAAGLLPDPLDRLRGRRHVADRRLVQTPELPRLRLLHPAGDARPGRLRLPNPSTALTGAYSQCELTYEQGRDERPIPGTERQVLLRRSPSSPATRSKARCTPTTHLDLRHPVFGRTITDMIEIGAEYPGWYTNAAPATARTSPAPKSPRRRSWSRPNRTRSWRPSPNLPFRYTGQVRICLSGTNMTVGNGGGCTGLYSGPIPSNGVVYVKNGTCSTRLFAVRHHLRNHLGLRQRLRERQLHRAADDRGRERRDHRRQLCRTSCTAAAAKRCWA